MYENKEIQNRSLCQALLHVLQLMMTGENSDSNTSPVVDNAYQVLDVAVLMAQVKGMVQ